jgi:hypothetical protein
MKPSRIDDLQSSLERARDRLQHCRNQRVTFEQQMDINSCADHRVLGRLCDDEEKSAHEVALAEQQIIEARPIRSLDIFAAEMGKRWRRLASLFSRLSKF